MKWYQKEATAQIDFRVFDERLANISKHASAFTNVFQTKTFLLPNLLNSTSANEIQNHFELNPKYGSESELSKMIKQLKSEQDTSVIMDLNAATTSRYHEWYKAFVEGRDKYANYYLLADDDYPDYLGYSTEKVIGRGKMIVKAGQPCLNLMNHNVRDEFKKIFDKWGRMNIKGFRLLGAPFLLEDPKTKKVSKSLELNQQLIREWTKELKHSVSDGVLLLQLDDQDASDYAQYFGTQASPIADIVVNKFVSRLDVQNSTQEIASQLESYINRTKPWNDELSNIGPWTGWLIDDLNESRVKDDLIICFGNFLGYTLPRGMPVTRLSFNLLHIGLPDLFFTTLERDLNNLEKGTFDNARIFAKLANLRTNNADAIMLGRTDFAKARVNGQLSEDVFSMIRSNDKQGVILIANLKNGPKSVTLDIDFDRYPRVAEVAVSCKIKEGHLLATKIKLDESISLRTNETLIATFDMTY